MSIRDPSTTYIYIIVKMTISFHYTIKNINLSDHTASLVWNCNDDISSWLGLFVC